MKYFHSKRTLFFLCSVVTVFLLVSVNAFAQSRERKTTSQKLEYSLRSLYGSASEVSQKNKWLASEIERMERQLSFYHDESRSLETEHTKRRVSTALDDHQIMDSIPWDKERLNMMYQDYIELDEENKYLKAQGLLDDEYNIKPIEQRVDEAKLIEENKVVKKKKGKKKKAVSV